MTATFRFRVEPEQENYFDVYGYGCGCECDSKQGALCEHDRATAELIESEGLWWVAREEPCPTCGHYEVKDSLGMVFGSQIEETKKEMTPEVPA